MAATPPKNDYNTFRRDIKRYGDGRPQKFLYVMKDGNGNQVGDLLTNGDLRQGEMVAWSNNTSTPTLVRFVRDGSAGKFVGVMRDSPFGAKKLGVGYDQLFDPPTITVGSSGVQLPPAGSVLLGVWQSGVHMMRATAGEVYYDGDPAFMAAPSSTQLGTDKITNTPGGGAVQIGTVYLPNIPTSPDTNPITIRGGPDVVLGPNPETTRIPVIIDKYTNYSGA